MLVFTEADREPWLRARRFSVPESRVGVEAGKGMVDGGWFTVGVWTLVEEGGKWSNG